MVCALHPPQPALDTCVHCGHFMCAACTEGGAQSRCPTCRASAQAEAAAGGALAQLRHAPVSVGSLCAAAWGTLQREPVMLVLAAFVTLLIGGAASIPGALVDTVQEQVEEQQPALGLLLLGVSILFSLLQTAIQGPLMMGQARMSARVLAGEPVDGLNALFGQWRTLLRYSVSTVLLVVAVLVPAVVVAVVLTVWASVAGYEPLPLYVAGGLVLSPLALWLTLPMTLLTAVYAFEEGVGPLQAFRRCYALAHHRRLLLFGLSAVAAGVLGLGLLACCLGFIPAFAFVQAKFTAAYLRLRDEEQVP